MLEIKNISKSINGKKIIKDINFKVNEGYIYGLLGPNGAGKTTIFYIIAGLLKCNSGEVLLSKKNITILNLEKSITNKKLNSILKKNTDNYYSSLLNDLGKKS